MQPHQQKVRLPYGSLSDNARCIAQAQAACDRLRATATLYGLLLPLPPFIDVHTNEGLHALIDDMCALYSAAHNVLTNNSQAPPLVVADLIPAPLTEADDPDGRIARRNNIIAGARYVTASHALIWGIEAAHQVILRRRTASSLPKPHDLPSTVRSHEFSAVVRDINILLTRYAHLHPRRVEFRSTTAFFRDMEHAVRVFLLATTGRISNIPHSAKCFLFMGRDTSPAACVQAVHVGKAASEMFRDLVTLAHSASE